jgi:hypothetical protein
MRDYQFQTNGRRGPTLPELRCLREPMPVIEQPKPKQPRPRKREQLDRDVRLGANGRPGARYKGGFLA